jgi:D-ribose pyranase
MLKKGILNPQLLSLLARVRHTNTLVIADRGFPFWPDIETIDLSVIDGLPSVNQILEALLPNFQIGKCFMAEEFFKLNEANVTNARQKMLSSLTLVREEHLLFKKRVPTSIGLIRTGDVVHYSNIILESA